MHRRSIATLAVLLGLAIAALAPALAPGDAPKPDFTRVDFFPPPFHGTLHATHYKCDVNRKVKIFRKSGRLVATTRSNSRGNWFVRRPNAHGYFYAKAVRERKENLGGDHTLLCLSGISRTRYFD